MRLKVVRKKPSNARSRNSASFSPRKRRKYWTGKDPFYIDTGCNCGWCSFAPKVRDGKNKTQGHKRNEIPLALRRHRA